MRSYIKILALCLVLLTSACAEIVVKEVHYADFPPVPEDAHPAPIKFSKLRFLLPPGTEIGLESGMGPALLGHFCSASNYPVNRRVLSRKFEKQYIDAAFEEALESIGYDVTNNIDLDFEYEDELDRAEYFISARVKDVDLDLCKRGRVTTFNVFNTAPDAEKGKLYAQIDWSVYDPLKRTTIYKTTTEGYSRRDYPNTEGLELLFMDAFDMAAHNLGADPHFYNLIVEGRKPPPDIYAPFGHNNNKSEQRRKFDPLEALTINNPPLRTQSFQHIAEDKRRVAVSVHKGGHGSGFLISNQGHILTNHHVVGNALRTRIILADKKEALSAEVLRVNKARDVALLKIIDIDKLPKKYLNNMPLLPIRTEWPAVSEDVYALGAPIHVDKLENTLSKGIISNHRRDYKSGAIRANYLQADVDIHGGNSGGPLLDKNGNIVGISVAGWGKDDFSTGLNLFIPIEEALEALDITLEQ